MPMNPSDQPQPPTFEGWAVVEVMGHRQHFGMVREVEMFGGKFCRVDIPDAPAIERDTSVHDRETGRYLPTKETVPALPARTHLYGKDAIFAITPCTEEVVRKALEEEQRRRVIPRVTLAIEGVVTHEGEY